MAKLAKLIPILFVFLGCGQQLPVLERSSASEDQVCSTPKPNDGCNQCECSNGTWACTEKACYLEQEDACRWTIGEGNPSQVLGVCTYKDASPQAVLIALPVPVDSEDSLVVSGGDSSYSLYSQSNELVILLDGRRYYNELVIIVAYYTHTRP